MRIETERLVLREFVEDDVSAVLEYQRTPEYQRLRGRDSSTPDEAAAFVGTFIAWQAEQPRRRFQLAISLRSDPECIGTCGIRLQKPVEHEATIGYELAPAFWGQGYATEAAAGMLVFGFQDLGLERVVAWCHVDNAGSAGVLTKIGMRREGASGDSESVPERWRNHYRFGIRGSEWRARAAAGPSIALHSSQSGSLKS